jgi:hypothetical protein
MRIKHLAAVLCLGLLAPSGLFAISFWLDAESGGVFTGYNDVQIPAETGTRFSLSEDLSAEPTWFYRLQGGVDTGRHSLFVLYAPLEVTSEGTFGEAVDFAGKTFPAGTPLTGTFRFNSYRLSYAYTLYRSSTLSFAAGLTGKVRDALIALEGGGQRAERTDLGFVPLIHLRLHWQFLPVLGLLVEGDGLVAPQGRAEDFLGALTWTAAPGLTLRAGYRILEGGSDGGGSVYTFSLFHYVTAGLRYTF